MKFAKVGDWVWLKTREMPPCGYQRMFHEEKGLVVKIGNNKNGIPVALV